MNQELGARCLDGVAPSLNEVVERYSLGGEKRDVEVVEARTLGLTQIFLEEE